MPKLLAIWKGVTFFFQKYLKNLTAIRPFHVPLNRLSSSSCPDAVLESFYGSPAGDNNTK